MCFGSTTSFLDDKFRPEFVSLILSVGTKGKDKVLVTVT